MAEIDIKWSDARRFTLDDHGARAGDRFYVLRYDIPGSSMVDHHHVIPIYWNANHKIDAGTEDPMMAMEYALSDAMAARQATIALGQVKVLKEPASPIVIRGREHRKAMQALETSVKALADVIPGKTVGDVLEGVRDIVLAPPEPLSRTALRASVPPDLVEVQDKVEQAHERLGEARQDFTSAVWDAVGGHPVNTNSNAWSHLVEMVGNDYDELGSQRVQWFDYRFKETVRSRTWLRSRGAIRG